jgi:hypothetical protein
MGFVCKIKSFTETELKRAVVISVTLLDVVAMMILVFSHFKFYKNTKRRADSLFYGGLYSPFLFIYSTSFRA